MSPIANGDNQSTEGPFDLPKSKAGPHKICAAAILLAIGIHTRGKKGNDLLFVREGDSDCAPHPLDVCNMEPGEQSAGWKLNHHSSFELVSRGEDLQPCARAWVGRP